MAGSFPFVALEIHVMVPRLWIWAVAVCMCLAVLSGCGGVKDTGVNRGLDRPTLPTNNK
jgi:hypothetical protein